MTKKAPIKIIKRDERNRQEQVTEEVAQESPRDTAREMVTTVTNWVNEFQQKRRAETTRALKSLFPEPPRPKEA